MNVKLVWITPNAEELVAYCARVSNPKNQNNPNIAKLLRYCIDNKHWSIYEMANFCVEIQTSRAIATQILRHRSFSFQEFSQRYSIAETWEPIELRRQAEKNRQSSLEVFDPESGISACDVYLNCTPILASQLVERHLIETFDLYNRLLSLDVAKECARFVLPLATQTTIFMTGNLRSWIHYIALRTDEHTQKEHRDIAEEIKKIFIEQCPTIGKALGWL